MGQSLGVAVAFSAGLFSFLSPCVLPLFPSYLSFITGMSVADLSAELSPAVRRRVLVHAIVFVLGFSLVFVGLGAYTYLHHEAFEKASEKLNWIIGGVNTVVLLVSSLMMVLALAAIQHGRIRQFQFWCGMTALLGIFFLCGQVYEFTSFVREGLTLRTNLFGATFFVLTGTHGAHVTVGVVWLLTLWVRAVQGKLTTANAVTVEICGLYWHFVDVVWIVIFTVVYLIQ